MTMTPWQRRFWEKAEAVAEKYLRNLAELHADMGFLTPNIEEMEDIAIEAVQRAIRKRALRTGHAVETP